MDQYIITDPTRALPRKLPQRLERFWRYHVCAFFKNLLFVSGVSTVASVFSSAMVAYGFARIRFTGRGSGLW